MTAVTARGQGQKSNASWSIEHTRRCYFNQSHFSSTISWEWETRGFPRHPSLLRNSKLNTIRRSKRQQTKTKASINPPHPTPSASIIHCRLGRGEERSHGDANRPWYRTVIRLSQANPYLNSPLIPLHTARFPDGPWASWPASNSLRRVCWKQRWRIKYHVLRRGMEGEKKIIPCFLSK